MEMSLAAEAGTRLYLCFFTKDLEESKEKSAQSLKKDEGITE